MLFFLEDLEQGIVLVGAGDSSDNCKGLDPVVSLSGVVRMPVATAVPCHPVDSFYDTLADPHARVRDFVLTKEGSHPCRSIHCNAVPGGLQQAHVAVVAPVAPVPFPAVEVGDAVLAHLVKGQIPFYRREGMFDGSLVAGVDVIGPEAIDSDGGKHLAWKLSAVVAGDWGIQDAAGLLPVAQLPYSLADEGMKGG